MKNKLLLLLLFVITVTLGNAQIVGANAFLKGTFVEAGINSCGSFGSSILPPAGFHPTETGISFVADGDMDGWATGSPNYCGDYSIPGSPVEGWSIELNGISYTNTDQFCSIDEISGAVTDYTTGPTWSSVTWEGNVGAPNVHVKQVSSLNINDLYILNTITITNEGASTITPVYYKRNIDPDNDQPWSGDFTTANLIVSNPPAFESALIQSSGLTYGCYLGIGSANNDARVSYGNFGTDDALPSSAWNGTGGYSIIGSSTMDVANQITFKKASLASGESVEFKFVYIFSETAVAEALAATEDIFVCNPPIDISDSLTTTTANFSWPAVPGATSYYFKYRQTGGAWTNILSPTPAIALTGLIECTDYEYRVFTICDTTNSAITTNTFTTDCAPCTFAPTGLSADTITTTTIKLRWDADPDAIKYKVSYGPVGAPPTTINATSNVKNITGLTPGTVYSFKVRSICGAGINSPFSASAVFTTLLKMPEYNPEIIIFPNPASNIITVNIKSLEAGELTIKIYDVIGNVVSEQQVFINDGNYNAEIPVSNFANGIYIVSAEQNGFRTVEQLVISK
jgi:hypothetical protein